VVVNLVKQEKASAINSESAERDPAANAIDSSDKWLREVAAFQAGSTREKRWRATITQFVNWCRQSGN
jgi:hypothetical protein